MTLIYITKNSLKVLKYFFKKGGGGREEVKVRTNNRANV